MAKFIKEIYNLRPWYHNFEKLGIQTNFPPEKTWIPRKLRYRLFGEKVKGMSHHAKQQPRKESVIDLYLRKALDGMTNPRILYLFCSDGYYGFLAQNICRERREVLVGVDKSKKDVDRAQLMAKCLGINSEFIVGDVTEFVKNNKDEYDLILCLGGLYHIEDPKELLRMIKNIGKYVLIQTAITVENNDPDYFVTPHPGWTWGSWFTDAKLKKWLRELNYTIICSDVNEREGDNPQKIGASYCLVKS